MKILIDALGISNQMGGVGRYSFELLSEMIKLSNNIKFKIIIRNNLHKNHEIYQYNKNNNVELFEFNIPGIGIKRQWKYFKKIKNNIEYDLFHNLSSNYPLIMNKNGIVTIHDLKYLKYPKYLGKLNKLKKIYLYFVFKNAIKNTEKVIAVSKSTKNDLLDMFDFLDENKINVIYEASNMSFNNTNEIILEKYNIKRPYFLYVGEHRPHKNIDGLIKAFEIFSQKNNSNYKLVIAGKKHSSFNYPNISQQIKENIIFTGFVEDNDLPSLYHYSYAFILISFYEGFGIPILEAMRSGTPVITSNRSSTTEIGGNACLKVNPNNLEKIADFMSELIINDKLYKKLSKKGKKRAREFSWEKAANETLKIYEEIIS